jgi:hypothetical protein
MSLRPRLGACAALLFVLAACGEQAETPSSPEASVSASADAEVSESATATASPAAASGATPLRMGELPAGQYTTNAFQPNLVLTLPEGWSQFFPDEDDEIAFGGPGVELNITRPPEVVDPETRTPVETPESLLEWFTGHPTLDVGEPVELEIDGIASHYVDVTAPSSEIDIFHYPPGNMRLPPGALSRIYIVPLDGPDLVALILAPAGAADFDAVLGEAEPIVTSLVIND